jgi:protein involved in polysaccharide export with SLBB domain
MQLIAMAGGLKEFANGKKIIIMRVDPTRPQGYQTVGYRFNYQEVLDRQNLKQNIELKPGDTVVVP